MAKTFADRSGGVFEIRSRQTRGTRATLRFPLASEAARDPAVLHPSAMAQYLGRVLVVDDNAPLRGGIVRRLRQAGLDVLEAEDAEKARTLIAGGIDVLITDIVLPGDTDGAQLAMVARAKDPLVALVFVSGFVSARQPELLASDELASFMRKPLELDTLVAVIDGLLATREFRQAMQGRGD